MARIGVLLIVGWVGTAFVGAACGRPGPQPQATTKPRVTVEVLRLQEVEDRVVVPASVVPSATVQVVAKVPGRVRAVHVSEGDAVHAGDLLVTLDPRDLLVAVRQAEGQVSLAAASLEAAQVQERALEKDFRRIEDLARTGSASQGDLDRVRAQYEAAIAQRKVAHAQVQVAQAALALARQNLEETRVVAPMDGVVVKRNVDPGQETAPGAAGPLIVLAAMDPVFIEGAVPEALWGRLFAGMPASVRLDGLPDQVYQGRVALLGPTVDPVSRMVRVRVEVENPVRPGAQRLTAGMAAQIELVPESARGFVIPMNAVRREESARLVLFFVSEQGRVVEKAVQPVRKEGLRFLAREGLSEGERLITAGPKELAPGDEVEVVAP